jgi:hypothetical protein
MGIAPELFGFNQVNGVSWQNRDYNDENLKQIPKALWSGQLRYPGGTVANYWYFPNATMASTCDAEPQPPSGFEPQCKDTFGLGKLRDKTERLRKNGEWVGGKGTLEKAWNHVQHSCKSFSVVSADGATLNGQCYSHESFCDRSSNDWDTENGACGHYLMGTTCGCCKPKPGGDFIQQKSEAEGPNEEGVQSGHKICIKKENVAQHPEMTFSIPNFVNGVGMASPVSAQTGLMFDLNVLTVDKASINLQIDYLHDLQLAQGLPVNFIELGNELFMNSHYSQYFPDAYAYMDKVMHSIAYAKQKLGDHVKVAVPIGFPFGGQEWDNFDDWNRILKTYCEPQCPFDAVTIHDYQANNETIDHGMSKEHLTYDTSQRRSALAAFGEAQLPRHVKKVNEFFPNQNLEIWVTEWSTSAWTGAWMQEEFGDGSASLGSGMNGIFLSGYRLAMLARSQSSDAPHTTAHLHSLNGFPHSHNAMVKEVSGGDPNSVDYNGHQEISCAAQITSHVSYIALHLSDRMRTVAAGDCGQLDFEVQGSSALNCLQAVAFEHSCRTDALPVYVVINRCTHTVTPSMDTSSHEGTPFRTLSYDSSANGWMKIDDIEPKSFHHPWHNGPQTPSVVTGVASSSTDFTLPPISLTVVEFSSTHVETATDCPTIFPCDDTAPTHWANKGKQCHQIPKDHLNCNNGYCKRTCCYHENPEPDTAPTYWANKTKQCDQIPKSHLKCGTDSWIDEGYCKRTCCYHENADSECPSSL